MQALTLSVVIPAFNEEDVIGDCLERLLAQREHIAEIVVVDNNSTDKTVDVVSTYVDRWAGVRVVTAHEQGLVYARNTGLDAATGDLLARIDADTMVPAGWARRIVDFFVDDADLRWAAACGRGEAYGLPYGDRLGALKRRLRERRPERVRAVPVLYGSNMVLRRETWTAVRDRVAMRRDVFEDVDTGLCVTETGGSNAFIPDITVGVAPRRMQTGMVPFVRYMACLPRTLLLHRKFGLAAGAAFGYFPAIVVLHGVRLLLLSLHDREFGKGDDRVAP